MNKNEIENLIQQMIDTDNQVNQFAVSQTPFHTHNGTDSSLLNFRNILNRDLVIPYTLPGAVPQTAANYGVFFIAPFNLTIRGITEVHATKGTDGSAVTLQIEKLIGTTAPASGVLLLTTAFDLRGTINTVQTGVLTTTVGAIQLKKGDRLGLKLTGTPTAVANLTITIIINY